MPLLEGVVNLLLDVIIVGVNVNMNCQSHLCGGQGDSVRRIFQRQQRGPAQTAIDLRKESVLYGIELGTIRRIMNHKKLDIQFVGKIHEVFLDDFKLAGVRASSVAEDTKRSGLRLLNFQMVFPHPLDIVTNESGSVVAYAHRHIAHIFSDVIYMPCRTIIPSLNVEKSWSKPSRWPSDRALPLRLKFPNISFFFVSMLMMGSPMASAASRMDAIRSNCSFLFLTSFIERFL